MYSKRKAPRQTYWKRHKDRPIGRGRHKDRPIGRNTKTDLLEEAGTKTRDPGGRFPHPLPHFSLSRATRVDWAVVALRRAEGGGNA